MSAWLDLQLEFHREFGLHPQEIIKMKISRDDDGRGLFVGGRRHHYNTKARRELIARAYLMLWEKGGHHGHLYERCLPESYALSRLKQAIRDQKLREGATA